MNEKIVDRLALHGQLLLKKITGRQAGPTDVAAIVPSLRHALQVGKISKRAIVEASQAFRQANSRAKNSSTSVDLKIHGVGMTVAQCAVWKMCCWFPDPAPPSRPGI
jgi:hypothetical protein